MFTCIECGEQCKDLYSTFPNTGILKIEHCTKCKQVVDKYIEFDITLVFLDLILLRLAAIRHILCNRDTGNEHWKLAFLCLFCDGYMKWISKNAPSATIDDRNSTNSEDVVFHAATQLQLYVMTIVSGLELSLFIFIVLFLCYVIQKLLVILMPKLPSVLLFSTSKQIVFNAKKISQALLFANCGKLLLLPAIVWGQRSKHLYYIIAHVICSSTVSLSIVTNFSYAVTATISVCSFVSILYLQPWTNSMFESNVLF
uniref:protein ARV1-like n=1 Tax=Styela clava TaxID=7725 RepID=UPI00193A3BC4|nr:protein ARV1-like [Styela clava]